MTYYFSKFISIIFHPIFIPLYAFICLFNLHPLYKFLPLNVTFFFIINIIIYTILGPLLLFFLLTYLKRIKNINLENRHDRIYMLSSSLPSYYFAYYNMHFFLFNNVIPSFLLATITLLVLAILISLKWKISLHTLGIGGFWGFYLLSIPLNNLTVFIPLTVVSGWVGTARLHLKAHNPLQIYAGYAIGFVSVFCTLFSLR